MTGTTSSRSRFLVDFESYKNQEWLRRRKLRIEQVRKQTNDLAKTLRKKLVDENRTRCDEYERMRDAKFRDWKAEKLQELEEKLRSALEEFGEGYKQAEIEPNPEKLIEERNKINQFKAQRRGEIAKQEQSRRRKLAEERKMSPIERKKMTRKLEDLRSALIRSVLVRNQSEFCDQETESEIAQEMKITLMKKKVRKHDQESPDKNRTAGKVRKKKSHNGGCQHYKGRNKDVSSSQNVHTVWVNLNDIHDRSDEGKNCMGSGKTQNQKPEGVVEFFNYPSRSYVKAFREFPNLVERINSDSEPNAVELAKLEEENEMMEAQKKLSADAVTQERGMEALRREKINRDYNNLIAKLEELHKKEKIIKAQQRIPSSLIHMNDERLSEKMRSRQRMMESKFESIYYEATTALPPREPQECSLLDRSGGGDYVPASEGISTRLSFSPSNLKTNSPVTPEKQSPMRTSPDDIRRFRNSPNKKQLLSDVERALKKGRKLRETVSRKFSDLEKSLSSEETKSPETSPGKPEGKTTKSQESQTEETVQTEKEFAPRDAEVRVVDDSLPLSTSTSYKSPPSVIRSHGLRKFLEYLEGLSETEEADLRSNPRFKRRMRKVLNQLLVEPDVEEKAKVSPGKAPPNPALEYYVEKLLGMSRECVANLSVSSENVSTPNITDLDLRNEDEVDSKSVAESERSQKTFPRGEDLIRQSRLSRAEKLEEAIKNWKAILERNSRRKTENEPEGEDEADRPGKREAEESREMEVSVLYGPPKVKSKYDEITRKCSERIWELSNMLEKVRRDKEKLLSSTSGESSLCLSKIRSEKGGREEEEEEEGGGAEGSLPSKISPVLETFRVRYDLPNGGENASTTAVADSRSREDPNESLESWPDVMDELLKRKIITSPFKWSEGDSSSGLTAVEENAKPSSIETVIGNFRKEMSKIKPFSLESACGNHESVPASFTRSLLPKASQDEREKPKSTRRYQEESSVESINHALTSLGLNWAKSFLRKNEESKAIVSSSGSSDEANSSADEEEKFFYRGKAAE